MEMIIVIAVLACVAYLTYKAVSKKATNDAEAAPYKVEDKIVAVVKEVADINNDGKVTVADAKAVVNKVAETVVKKTTAPKKPATKPATKAPAKKPAAKPAVKKAPVKKPATPKK